LVNRKKDVHAVAMVISLSDAFLNIMSGHFWLTLYSVAFSFATTGILDILLWLWVKIIVLATNSLKKLLLILLTNCPMVLIVKPVK
jgi:hypothetical protein